MAKQVTGHIRTVSRTMYADCNNGNIMNMLPDTLAIFMTIVLLLLGVRVKNK